MNLRFSIFICHFVFRTSKINKYMNAAFIVNETLVIWKTRFIIRRICKLYLDTFISDIYINIYVEKRFLENKCRTKLLTGLA